MGLCQCQSASAFNLRSGFVLNRAYEYLLKAVELGHVPSMERVAFAYLYGNHIRQNVSLAKEMFEQLAVLGSPRGQLVMTQKRASHYLFIYLLIY